MIIFLTLNKVPPSILLLSTLAYLILGNQIAPEKFFTVDKALIGFSRDTVLLIGILIVIAAAIKNTGLVENIISQTLGKSNNPKKAFLRLSLPLITTSAFLNNTPIVAITISTVRYWASKQNINASSLLLPFVYVTTFGGMLTLIGTTTILLVSSFNLQNGIAPIGFFTPALITLPCSLLGIFYLQKFVVPNLNKKLPPHPPPLSNNPQQDNHRKYSLEMKVIAHQQFDGKTIDQIETSLLKNITLLQVARHKKRITPTSKNFIVKENDLLILVGNKEQILTMHKIKGLQTLHYLDDVSVGKDERFIEVVIADNSPLIGNTLNHLLFNTKYNAQVLSLHRHSATLHINISNTILKAGDVLLLIAKKGFRRIWQNTDDFYLISPLRSDLYATKLAPICLAIVIPMILLSALGMVSIFYTSMAAFILLLITGCLKANEVVKQIDWDVLLIIGSAFGISAAIEGSGASHYLAKIFITLHRFPRTPRFSRLHLHRYQSPN